MSKHTLQGENRTISGRKVKKIRRDGLIPATVYGKGIDSESVSVKLTDFTGVYAETGETGLIELSLGKSVRPVLVHNVHRDPVTGQMLHVEFHQVNLKEKVHAEIPLVIEGVAPAVEQKLGLLIQSLNSVDVDALPAELPEQIDVNVANLEAVGDEVRVSDLVSPQGVTITTDGELSVAKIAPLPQEEVVVAPAPVEGEEAAVPTEGEETPSETPEVSEKPENG